MDFDLDKEYYFNHNHNNIVKCGCVEILSRFQLPYHPKYPKVSDLTDVIYCHTRFFKKNTNRYFRKHLGFTYQYWNQSDFMRGFGVKVKINDPQKFLVFLLKYGLRGVEVE
jgi:hypothetical protein